MSDAPTTTTRSRENTRARLLDAAFDVFADVGLDAASVEAVCERAGFTRGAFYSNFESKDELFMELAQTVSERKLTAVTDRVREFTGQAPPAERPEEIVRQLVDVSLDSRQGVLLMSEIRARAMRDARMAASYREWSEGMVQRVAGMADDLIAAYGLGLRLTAADFARIMLEVWESTLVNAVIDELDDAATGTRMHSRTQALVAAVVEGFAD
ncbi:TetR/AcrR family transcriptional regulator [Microbacterium elymi]|uniref:TetR/AcrR family transcriptional regulator n=1 Tax=Microbacterium elymi TaxID=2909587 RepID=A0ABY5NI30_9MICO|nr:TetR/AcrR family transcriptional regulator [Microbacterium elymi]UUT34817.1 TetR/AcrR family transcriptional regulator [Microbacterium elymi]